MKRVIVIVSLVSLLFSCLSNKSKYVMDCEIKKVNVKEDDRDFVISASKAVQQINELVSERKREVVKFKPKYWVEMVGSECSLKFGVQGKFVKIDGVTYILNQDLEEIIAESLQKEQ